jgi:hypothetical protein
MADYQIGFSAGLTVIIFSAQFIPIEPNIAIGLLLLIVGIAAMVWAYWGWSKLK